MVVRVHPGPLHERPLAGLYLGEIPEPTRSPFVYANFLTSLDGRIAVRGEEGLTTVPPAIANDRDWRLYTELLMQADAVLTTGRHAAAIARGVQSDMVTLAHERYPDLRGYRRAQGLTPHPACVVVGSRLDLPAAALKAAHPGAVLAVTGLSDPVTERVARASGVELLVLGHAPITGQDLLSVLAARGLTRAYMVGGPRLFHALLADHAVHRLYMTTAARVLGGEPPDIETLVRGPLLKPPVDAVLRHLTLDTEGPFTQTFACYDLGAR